MSGAVAMPLLEVDRLRVVAGKRVLIEGLSLTVHAGDVWCVLGANGAGKTLLLQTLAGLRPSDGGSITLAQRPLAAWRAAEAARVRGFLPQFNAHAFPTTVAEAVHMGRHPHLSRWAWEDAGDVAHAHAVLARVGLEGFAARDVTTLSGGERQRAAIATLLVQDPPLMLLDEPIAHLDLKHQLRVLDVVIDLSRREHAIVLSIHDLTLARRCATHALLLHGDGRAQAGRVDEVMRDAALSDAFACRIERVDASGRPVYIAQ